jgi:hypothetical protein
MPGDINSISKYSNVIEECQEEEEEGGGGGGGKK